jgi:ribose/xylose/arabinose/galactoside ABC-type transport system permease subunit
MTAIQPKAAPSSGPTEVQAGSTPSRRMDVGLLATRVALLITVIAVIVFLATTEKYFTTGNLKSILLSCSIVGIVALGQTVIMTGGSFVTLSIGATVAVCAMVFLWALQYGLILALVIAIALGIIVSVIQGWAIGAWGANPVIITIGATAVIQSVALIIGGGATVLQPTDSPSLSFLTKPIGGIAFSFYAFVVLVILLHLFLTRTRWGVLVYLVGENSFAARAAGLPVTMVVTITFLIAGVMAAVAGILLGAQQGTASLSVEGNLVFEAIAATLLGGTLVSGGIGSAPRTLFGALAISAITSGLLLRGYSVGVQDLVRGMILLVAVLFVQQLSQTPILRRRRR